MSLFESECFILNVPVSIVSYFGASPPMHMVVAAPAEANPTLGGAEETECGLEEED